MYKNHVKKILWIEISSIQIQVYFPGHIRTRRGFENPGKHFQMLIIGLFIDLDEQFDIPTLGENY